MIYVGRLDYNQKRVYRIIETWALLDKEYPDWRLTIVGDGAERKNLEKLTQDLNLHNISFEGFRRPEEYYKRASLLVLTSEYEGFPLVLAESMSFGVVPVVYGSYSAVYDIIDDGNNGVVLPFTADGFHAERMASKLSTLMSDDALLFGMSFNAIRKSKQYAVENIYSQWTRTFEALLYAKDDQSHYKKSSFN